MPDPTLALRRQPRDSLATKIIFFVFFSTFVTALVVSWISVHSTYAFLRSHLDRSYPQILERGGERIASWVADGANRLEALARDPAVARTSGGARDAREAAEQALAAALEQSASFDGLVATDARGVPVASAGRSGLSSHFSKQLDPATDAGVRDVAGHLVAATPIRDADGRPIGTLHAVFAVEVFADQLHAARLPEDPQLYLVDAAGRVVASS